MSNIQKGLVEGFISRHTLPNILLNTWSSLHFSFLVLRLFKSCATGSPMRHVPYLPTRRFCLVQDYLRPKAESMQPHRQESRLRSLRSPVSLVSMMAQSFQNLTLPQTHLLRKSQRQHSNGNHFGIPSGKCVSAICRNPLSDPSGSSLL